MTAKINILLIVVSFFMCSRTHAMEELGKLLTEIEPPIASQDTPSRLAIPEVNQSTMTERSRTIQDLREAQIDLTQQLSMWNINQQFTHLESLPIPSQNTPPRMMPVSTGASVLAATIIAIKATQIAERNSIPDRFPPALLLAAPVFSFLKSQGVTIAAGVSTLYLVNKAVHAVNTMIHAPCKAREKEIVEEFKKTVADAIKALGDQFTDLQQEVLRQTEQARMNSVDALIKADGMAQGLSSRLETLEKKLAKTDLKKELEPLREELRQQQKKLDQLRKQKDPAIATLRQDFDTLHQKFREVTKAGTAGASNAAIATLALQMQRVSEDLKRHENETASSTPCSTPRPLSLNLPRQNIRRASISGSPSLSPVAESGSAGPAAPTLFVTSSSPKRSRSSSYLFGLGTDSNER